MPETAADPGVRIGVLGGHRPSDLETVVRGLPRQLGIALIISCGGASDIAGVLRSVSALPLTEVDGAQAIEPDHIYVVPAHRDVEIRDGRILVGRPARQGALDKLLRSVADTHGRDAAVVLLSAPGADGVLGLKRIKEAGGVTITKLPDGGDGTDELPRKALATGMVDLALPLPEIPGRLYALGNSTAAVLDEPPSEQIADTLRDILTMVRIRSGHDFTFYKRATLYRRVARRMQVCQAGSINEYGRFLREHPAELANLLRDFLISVTNFFRDPEAWEALAQQVVPKLFAGKSVHDQVRVWVAGCATGEEAYSLGILLAEHASRLRDVPQIQIFATDIDEDALAEARGGRYPETIAVDVSAPRLERFFTRDATSYRVNKELREMMLFSPHNVLRDPPFSRLDLVTCRNLLIYLNRDAQDRVLNMFHFGLRHDGHLFLGSSESAETGAMQFTAIDPKQRIFVRRLVPSAIGVDSVLATGRWQPSTLSVALPVNPDRAVSSFGELHHRIVEQYAPPSVLVNDELEVVHVSEHAGAYLQIAGGEPTRQIMRLIHPALRLELRAAIYAARQPQRGTDRRVVRYDDNGVARAVELRVRALDVPDVGRGALLVTFEEVVPGDGAAVAPAETSIEPVVREIEDELQRTRDQLRTTIEQYETSLEELKASNEELHAINEELRSASEELETGREELQSVNEELTTVNHELKGKVDEVSRANSDLQNLITSTEIGVVFLDRALDIKRFTPRAQELFNIIPSDVGRPLAHVTHQLDAQDLPEAAASVLQTLRTIERQVTTRSGRRYLARLLPYRSLEDRIEGVVLTFIDMTERFEAVAARRQSDAMREESDERLRLALRTAPVVVLSLDSEQRITWGFAHGRELDGHADTRGIFAPGHAERLAQISQEVIRTGAGQRAELDLMLDRSPRTYDFRIEPGGGAVTAVGFDITPSKIAEATLRESDRRKDEFLATLSHELRNPLTPLRIALDVVQLAAAPPEVVAESRRIMSQQVDQLTQLVDDLLDISRITQGKLQLERTLVDPAIVVERAVEVVRPSIHAKRQTLQLDLRSGGAHVVGDLARLTQVLVNLLANASKYTPEGARIVLALSSDAARGIVTMRVHDTGIGIPANVLPHIFELFVQGRDAEGRSQSGLGIGLNLVRRLVEAHDGRVSARSTPGSGSELVIELPLART